jgi:hypothetical protein
LTVASIGDADEVFFNRPGLAIVKWDPTIQAVSTEWQGSADRADVLSVFDAILQAIKKHHASRGLIDTLRLRALSQADQDWVLQVWFPRALAAGLRRWAVVMPESTLAMLSTEDVSSGVRGTMLDGALFSSVAEARKWLTGPR